MHKSTEHSIHSIHTHASCTLCTRIVYALTLRLLIVPIKFRRNQINFRHFLSLHSLPHFLYFDLFAFALRFVARFSTAAFCNSANDTHTVEACLITDFRQVSSPPDRSFEIEKEHVPKRRHSEQKKIESEREREMWTACGCKSAIFQMNGSHHARTLQCIPPIVCNM